MPSLFKQHGKYYVQFYEKGRDPERKRVPTSTSRKRDAEQICHRLTRAWRRGRFDPWTDDPKTFREKERKPITLREAAREFLEDKREEGCTEYTLSTYEGVLNRALRIIGSPELRDLTPDDLREAVVTPLPKEKGARPTRSDDGSLSGHTKHKRWRTLKTVIRWARDKSYLGANPMASVPEPKVEEKIPKAVLPHHLQAIEYEMRDDYRVKRVMSGDQVVEDDIIWRIPLFWFMLYTGLRPTEAARLRHRDVQPEEGIIIIRKSKSGGEQTAPLSDAARRRYEQAAPGDPDDYVWRSPRFEGKTRSAKAWRNNTSRVFTRYRKRALPGKDDLTLYGLRHGFCTLLALSGEPAHVIRDAARHEKIETSMRYVHMAKKDLTDRVNNAFDDE